MARRVYGARPLLPDTTSQGHYAKWQHEAAVRVEQQFREQHFFCLVRERDSPLAVRERICCKFHSQCAAHQRTGADRLADLPSASVASLPSSLLPVRISEVAAFLTNLAIIVQLALKQGGEMGSRWRVWLLACAVKVAPESRPTWSSATLIWTSPPQPETVDLWKLADGLPLFGGAQLAIDTILVFSFRRNAGDRDGIVLEVARRRKEWTHPELFHCRQNRACLVVLAVEVERWWSVETRSAMVVVALLYSLPSMCFLVSAVAGGFWRGWGRARDVFIEADFFHVWLD